MEHRWNVRIPHPKHPTTNDHGSQRLQNPDWYPDKVIGKLLITGFSSQLKGWWDYHLIETETSSNSKFHNNLRTNTYLCLF